MLLTEATAPPYHLRRGSSPLIVSIPHAGTLIPASIARTLTDAAAMRTDTDWHLPKLYDFLGALDATVIAGTHSRYVVDLNRPRDDTNLYPGQDTTGLCPVDTFDRRPLYRNGPPDRKEIERRIARYWEPYHLRLASEIARVKAEHGRVVLWDAHSIVGVAPRFFEGRLPDLNFGTADGKSCAPGFSATIASMAARHPYSHVLNGRFKGGYITRRYGAPSNGVQAIQLEMVQAIYMDEHAPYPFRDDLAARIRPVLRVLLETASGWAE
ncbi:hypothetical protein DSM104443_01649 [Usitatibacter rugosus]|uniref:N-formylglutamate deformylase n=1 Tax=Usitatibacter rugosus TaxID=2732067 RepID=A0A6M4GUA9_9PROT|nr:N-formylglutamate deformylase [Usitatibacter rugosus]QJR10585.1 hypothetical protein DSM104443_01649 [Usitatibacter rugosus]